MAIKFSKTKQGVRDLDAVYGKVKAGKKVELPVSQFCNHPNMKHNHLTGDQWCPDCKRQWDWDGKEY